jgi:hypothetical protein
MKYQGEQSFDVDKLIEIAECVEKWGGENFAFYNNMTRKFGGEKLFAPTEHLAKGVGNGMVEHIWKITQDMDIGSYNTLNYLLIETAYFLVPPPPPLPPPGGGDE